MIYEKDKYLLLHELSYFSLIFKLKILCLRYFHEIHLYF